MTTGIYKHKPCSEATKRKLSLGRLKRKQELGYINSPETREKIRLAQIGNKNGLGHHHTPDTIEKMSEVKKELWQNTEYREKHLGENHPMWNKHHSPETKRKISEKLKGNKNMLGKHLSEETKRKIGITRKGRIGEKSSNYKGNKAGQSALHYWVKNHKPKPKLCEFCGNEKDHLGHSRLALANIKNHKYARNLNDWKYGHYSCHSKYDRENRGKNYGRTN